MRLYLSSASVVDGDGLSVPPRPTRVKKSLGWQCWAMILFEISPVKCINYQCSTLLSEDTVLPGAQKAAVKLRLRREVFLGTGVVAILFYDLHQILHAATSTGTPEQLKR